MDIPYRKLRLGGLVSGEGETTALWKLSLDYIDLNRKVELPAAYG